MRLLDCNQSALSYWKATGYTSEEMRIFLAKHDATRLAAQVTFKPGDEPLVRVSTKTWEAQSGHYITMTNFFRSLAKHPVGSKLSGSIAVWLDDGIYSYESQHFMKVPTFCFSRSIYDNHSLLIPDPAFIENHGYAKTLKGQAEFESYLPFEDRTKTMFWRGAASGLGFTATGWKETHRGKLTLKAKELNQPNLLDATFSKADGWPKETIASIEDSQVVSSSIPFLDFLKYRYLVDADGITCAWISLFRKLASQSVTVKMMSEYMQWYYHLIKPWEHYVPMRADAEDVELIYEWLINHPDECQRIIKNANQLISTLNYDQEVDGTATLISEILKYAHDK